MAYDINDKRMTVGILAHVDAGKTTLAESMLYDLGVIKTPGRVDKGSSFLDTFELERKRGITIFSKQARFKLGDIDVTLIDTPGHIDFAPEAERSLGILDLAILVISGTDGVQSHTVTLLKLLKHYNVPFFIFVNKMDIAGFTKEELLKSLNEAASDMVADLSSGSFEDIAAVSEFLMNEYLEKGTLSDDAIKKEIMERKLIPAYFGAALKNTGVHEFIEGLGKYAGDITDKEVAGDAPFTARVSKIMRDKEGVRLTCLKVLSGTLSVRDKIGEDKVDRIRLYSGEKFEYVEKIGPGTVAHVLGLENTFSGQLIGDSKEYESPVLSPVMSYSLILPGGTDVHKVYRELLTLKEELPETDVSYVEETKEIMVMIMGAVQLEILKNLILERIGLDVSFGVGKIIYKETVKGVSEGVGHFEPLRHYAEAHIKIEPNERGRGIEIFSNVSTDELDLNWQRLIMTHLAERKHRGVLTGSQLTDVKFTVIGGRSHPKHTEGGDFRQATYRAVRHGLMYNESVLLEPFYDFCIEVPEGQLGRAMNDVQKMNGTIRTHSVSNGTASLYGRAPVSKMHGYQEEVMSYTKGTGHVFLSPGGYDKCGDAEAVIAEKGYDPVSDLRNTPDSVFCSNGSGYVVPWDEVYDHMHVERKLAVAKTDISEGSEESGEDIGNEGASESDTKKSASSGAGSVSAYSALDNELAAIFNKTYGSGTKKETGDLFRPVSRIMTTPEKQKVDIKKAEKLTEYLLVDGYNIVFAWPELKALAADNLDAARGRLSDMLANYRGFKNITVILVFDAYKVKGGTEKTEKYHGIHIVYTKEAETADSYIEKTTGALVKKGRVTVATGDAAEQFIIYGEGALRMSATELHDEIVEADKQIREILKTTAPARNISLIDAVPDDVQALLNELRLKEKN